MVVNYTEEMTEKLVKTYTEGLANSEDSNDLVEALAVEFDKPKRSIIGKLSKEGVYVKKQYLTKAGEPPITKKAMIHQLSTAIGADPEKLQGLEKAPKIELQYLIEVLKRGLSDQ